MNIQNLMNDLLQADGANQNTVVAELKAMGVPITQASVGRIANGWIKDPRLSLGLALIELHRKLQAKLKRQAKK